MANGFELNRRDAQLRGAAAANVIPPGGSETVQGILGRGDLEGWMPNYGATMRPASMVGEIPAQIPRGYAPVKEWSTPGVTSVHGGNGASQEEMSALMGQRKAMRDAQWAKLGNSGRGMAAEAAPAAAGLMGYAQEAMQHMRNLFQSGAADAAISGVPGAVEAAPGMARGALGTAARWALPAQTAVGLGSALVQAFDPNSAIRQASVGAKADMRRDWAEGNFGRAAGDAVRATALPLWEAAKEVMAPTPIWGSANQQGLVSGLLGGERPEQRAAREQDQKVKDAYGARVQATDDAVNQARSEFNARQGQGGGVAQQPGISFNNALKYGQMYHMMAPKVQTWNDILDQMSAMAMKAEYERMKADPKLAAEANAQLLRNRAALKQPQAGLMLNAFPGVTE